MPAIRIRVGASVDGNPANVFVPFVTAAKAARAAIENEMNRAGRAGRALGPAVKAGASQAETAMDRLRKEVSGLQSPMSSGVATIEKFGTSARSSFTVARQEFNRFARDAERNLREIDRRASAPSAFNQRLQRDSVRSVGRYASHAVDRGARLVGSVIRGAGVSTDVGQLVGANVSLESKATQLSNAGYMAGGAGANGVRQDPQAIIAQARAVGNETAFSANQAIEGLQAFVAKTGDLDTGRKILKDMAVLSKATGTELENMVDAAGDAANQLGDMENKGEVIGRIMRIVAGQGKLGAVEIKDMASQMAKVAASASKFEGGAEQNIGILGAFAQEARQRGGASSARMATTAVGSFVNTFSKGARLGAFSSFGVNVNGQGGLRDPREIIIDAMNAAQKKGGTKDFNLNMGKMFMDAQSRRVTSGFETVYQQSFSNARGNEQERMAEATKAVREEMDRLTNAQLASAEVTESFRRQMQTTESKIQIMNNNFQESAQQLQNALIPAFIELAPLISTAATGLAEFIRKLRGDPVGNRGNVELGLQAQNTSSAIQGALGGAYGTEAGGTMDMLAKPRVKVPAAIFDAASEQHAALEKALAEKEAEARSQGIGLMSSPFRPHTDDEAASAARAGDTGAASYLKSSSEASALRSALERLDANQRILNEALLSGRALRVEVTNPTKPATPPPRPAPEGAPFAAETD